MSKPKPKRKVEYAFGATPKTECADECGRLLNGKTVTWTDEIHPGDRCDRCNKKAAEMEGIPDDTPSLQDSGIELGSYGD